MIPLGLQAHGGGDHKHAAASKRSPEAVNPLAEYWRKVREGVAGYTAVRGQETQVLIQGNGQNWRQLRNGPIAGFGGAALAVTVFALGVFYLWLGKVPLIHPRTGETVRHLRCS
ncbi:MAG TPA: hypothetical protein VLU73_15750 [Methylococcaceae bacterium]|nr:hypothetical protein [Methylococcaceae bacterium]